MRKLGQIRRGIIFSYFSDKIKQFFWLCHHKWVWIITGKLKIWIIHLVTKLRLKIAADYENTVWAMNSAAFTK